MSIVAQNRNGFSLTEAIVAIVLLTVGLLAMVGAMRVAFIQIGVADRNTDRAAVVRSVVDEMMTMPFDSVASRSEADARVIDGYEAWWAVTKAGPHLKRVEILTRGPGIGGSGLSDAEIDTVVVSVAKL